MIFFDSFLLDTETLTNAITYQHITTNDKSYSQKDAKHCSVFVQDILNYSHKTHPKTIFVP